MGKRELICLLSFTCNYVVSVRTGFLLGMVCVIYCGTPCAFLIIMFHIICVLVILCSYEVA